MVMDSDTTVTGLRNEHWETASGLWSLGMRGRRDRIHADLSAASLEAPEPLRSGTGAGPGPAQGGAAGSGAASARDATGAGGADSQSQITLARITA